MGHILPVLYIIMYARVVSSEGHRPLYGVLRCLFEEVIYAEMRAPIRVNRNPFYVCTYDKSPIF